jgi:hypothetical protein
MKDEKEAFFAHFKLLFCNLSGGTEKKTGYLFNNSLLSV